ncbi:ABC transporter permease [Anaerobacillus sp. MEB173]|uniref:ABC transporter permease n=1 Tax=Anaerobacillus sp. MEB173 TaxID=3383345 RepID=UPI003F8E226E
MKLLRLSQRTLFTVIVVTTLTFIFLPMFIVFFDMKPSEVISYLNTPLAIESLKLSLWTTVWSLSLIVLFGTPLAYFLAKNNFKGKQVLDVLIQLPIVIPPAVAGVGLLMVFGRFGLLGKWFDLFGIQIGFTAIAVIMAQAFIAAPFYIMAARTAFSGVDSNLDSVSRTLGGSRIRTFFKVTLPLSLPGLLTGAALSWGRALGEFGATIMFAGNLPGHTQTMPLAIFAAMESDMKIAIALSALLIIVSFCLLLSVKIIEHYPAFKIYLKKRKGKNQWLSVKSKRASGTLN